MSGLPNQSTTPHDHTGRSLPCTRHELRIKLENDACPPPLYSQNKCTKLAPNLNPFSRRVSRTHMVTGSLTLWLSGSLALWLSASLALWLSGSLDLWLSATSGSLPRLAFTHLRLLSNLPCKDDLATPRLHLAVNHVLNLGRYQLQREHVHAQQRPCCRRLHHRALLQLQHGSTRPTQSARPCQNDCREHAHAEGCKRRCSKMHSWHLLCVRLRSTLWCTLLTS